MFLFTPAFIKKRGANDKVDKEMVDRSGSGCGIDMGAGFRYQVYFQSKSPLQVSRRRSADAAGFCCSKIIPKPRRQKAWLSL
jgi:hypothetical protein